MRTHLTLPLMESKLFLIFPESTGRYMDEPDHKLERLAHNTPHFNLHYVKSGEGFVEVDGQWEPLYAGDAFLYFPNQHQKYRTSESNPWDVYWLHFYGDRLVEILTEQGFWQSVIWSTRHGKAIQKKPLGNYSRLYRIPPASPLCWRIGRIKSGSRLNIFARYSANLLRCHPWTLSPFVESAVQNSN